MTLFWLKEKSAPQRRDCEIVILQFWIFGILGILDFGFLEHYVADLYVQSLDFGIWGFWILGILDFGFWGSWILDFGLGILDGHLVTKIWMLHKKRRLCTPNRVGGFIVTIFVVASNASHFFGSCPLSFVCYSVLVLWLLLFCLLLV